MLLPRWAVLVVSDCAASPASWLRLVPVLLAITALYSVQETPLVRSRDGWPPRSRPACRGYQRGCKKAEWDAGKLAGAAIAERRTA